MHKFSTHPSRYAALIGAILLYALALIFLIVRLSNPSDGTRLGLRASNLEPGAVTIQLVIPQDGGLQADDSILRINGIPIANWVDAVFDLSAKRPGWNFDETVIYTAKRGGLTLDIPVQLRHYPLEAVLGEQWAILLFLVGLQVEAGWIFACRPDERLAQILFVAVCATVTFSICHFIGMDVVSFVSVPGLWLYYRLAITFGMGALESSLLLHFALILSRLHFSRLVASRLIFFIYALPYPAELIYIALIYKSRTLEWLRDWEVGSLLVIAAYFTGAMIALGRGYYRLQEPLERRRIGIVALTFSLTTLLMFVLGWLPSWTMQQPPSGWGIVPLFALPLAIGLAVAVVFYQLLDIRVFVQRTVVWGTLTLMVIAVYSAVVGTLSVLFQSRGNPVFSLVATGLAAVLFHPLRMRLQHKVTVLLFGERDAPYEVMTRLTKKLEAALAPQDALHTIVQTIGEALRVSYTAIELCQDGHFVIAAEYGTRDTVPCEEWIEFPLNYGSETVGRLVVAPRLPGETLTAGDRRLISGLVHHAEVTIQTARLTAALQHSRERLVVAREEERQRLRRDLHDELGPALVSLMLQIDAARNLLVRDTAQADSLLLGLESQVQSAVTEIRRLAHELRPPTLDELGLVAALSEKARQVGQVSGVMITIDAPGLPALPAAVESAAYRIVLEALTNTSRHARATSCSVRLTLNGRLGIEIHDNGNGLPPGHRRGVGINSMMERAAELGGTCLVENALEGGTRVVVSLPLTVPIVVLDQASGHW